MTKTFENGKWLYGDSFEKFPIKEYEQVICGKNFLIAGDIMKIDYDKLFCGIYPDMAYIDPPYNQGLLSSFWTKFDKSLKPQDFKQFTKYLIFLIKQYSPRVAYMEMGIRSMGQVTRWIIEAGGFILGIANITYYHKNPCKLIRFTFDLDNVLDFDMNIVDFCCGRGLTGRIAHELGIQFFGSELNPRRLTNLVEFYANN